MAIAICHVPRQARRPAWAGLGRSFAGRAGRAAVREQLHLAGGERVLIGVADPGQGCVVGTERGLYWCPPGAGWLRLGWEEIGRVDSDRRTGAMLVTGLAGERRRVRLPGASERLIAFARERVVAARFVATRVAVGDRELRVEGRRQPGSGTLAWFVRFDGGLDPDDVALAEAIERAVAALRADLGV